MCLELDGGLDAVVAELTEVRNHLDPATVTSPPTAWASNAQHHESRKRSGRSDGSVGGIYLGGW